MEIGDDITTATYRNITVDVTVMEVREPLVLAGIITGVSHGNIKSPMVCDRKIVLPDFYVDSPDIFIGSN